MSIESTRAPEGTKTTTTEAGRGKAISGRTAGTGGQGGESGGFADLMSSLSAPDVQSLPSDTSQPTAGDDLTSGKDDAQSVPLALDGQGLIAINLVPAAAPPVTPALLGGKGSADKSQAANVGEVAATAASATPAVASDVSSLLNGRRATQSHAAVQGQFESREARLQPGHPVLQLAPEADRVANALVNVDVSALSTERRDGKTNTGQVRTGLEGASGGAVADRLGISPTYEIAAASAVVPDTPVAETVSYWATQGVQNAELTLDGLGFEPVEVRISIDGDQTQVDFRSNQPDVRQALESASAQLKTMLSGEGLQLTGMSVGTSGQGNTPSEGRQPRSTPRQSTLVAMEPVQVAAARPGNPSVGRALDLYV
ncbi:flagellar hook-length control protein FliK [Rhodoferax sp. U11-2br]|uniref:flagellar hook-length control protein FliK n=1 Tax=Rhodoferax sp. U11-2br TaxID=2838878 RepID=UPI001BE89C80|nr:flagellar hook-length control protein FliK [Rhodoferax sp. U11-2br]MBT3067592.1 flagellar hook-length control protein FliK [Rhodoferax sp. U11-2br]